MNEISENVSFDSEFALAFEMQPFKVAFFLNETFSKYFQAEWVKKVAHGARLKPRFVKEFDQFSFFPFN